METFRIPRLLSQPHLAERRYGHGKSGPLHYPGVVLPGKNAGPGSGGEGHLYGQGQKVMQGFPRFGMAGHDVFAHPEQGRADGEILRLLRQRLTGKKTEGRQRRGYPLHPRTPGGRKNLPSELGAFNTEDWSLSRRRPGRYIPWSVRNVRGPCGSSAASKTRRSSGTSSSIWESGWSGPSRRRKLTPRQSGNTPLPISSSKHTPILSTATPNTHGMNTSNHYVSRKKA